MKKHIRRCCCGILLMAGAAAGAQEKRWVQVASANTHVRFHDKETIQVSGSRVIVWERRLYHKPFTDTTGDTYDREIARVEHDCQARTSKTMDLTQTLKGEFVWTGKLTSGHTAVMPETVGEGAWRAACAYAQ